MRKIFMALMAVAAITFVGCKSKNAPEEPKPEVKLFYEVKLTGSITDYLKLNVRYVDIPDSNSIMVKENMTADWTPEEYTVQQGVAAVYGLEPSIRVTELFKQTFTDQAKHNTMVQSNSSLKIAMGFKTYAPDGSVETVYAQRCTFNLSEAPFDPSSKNATINSMETAAQPDAYNILLDKQDCLNAHMLPGFWDRH